MRGLFGERARTAVYGWSDLAFDAWHIKRNVLGHTVHIVLKPEWIERVLLDNAANYEKPRLVKRILDPTIGRGLLSSDGELWRAQRKIVAASFTPPAVDALVPVFGEVGMSMAQSWEAGVRDMVVEATSATMAVIAQALFSGDPRLTSREAMDHITAAMEGVGEARIQVLLGLPLIPIGPSGRRGQRGIRFLRKTLDAIVRERLGGDAPDDFVTGMTRALLDRFPRDEAIELAVDNAATFYLAGHETTANTTRVDALPAVGAAGAAGAGGGRGRCGAGRGDRCRSSRPAATASLDPRREPAPLSAGSALRPRGGRGGSARRAEIHPGDLVSIWPWIIQRHRKLWDEPDVFDRGGSLPVASRSGTGSSICRSAAGPRTCVGARFAMAEALTILAIWLSCGVSLQSRAGRCVVRNGDAAAQRWVAADPR